jgi:hypothetical protein
MCSSPVDLIAEGIDKLAAEDLDGLMAGPIGDDLVELAREHTRLGAEIMRRSRRWDTDKGWSIDGSLSGASWLAKRCGWSQGEAKSTLTLAHQLAELPAVEAALADGELSVTKAKVIAREVHAAAEHLPEGDQRTPGELFERCAKTIVDYAKTGGVRQLGHVMAAFRDSLDPDGGLAEWNAKQARRRLAASRTLDGTVRVDGLLDPESGETFLGTLGQLEHLLYEQDRADHPDGTGMRAPEQRRVDADRADHRDGTGMRTPEQRRVDALALMAALAQEGLDELPDPDTEPDTPQAAAARMRRQRGWDATVTIELDELRDGCAHPGHYGSGEPITTATANRLLCDAAVSFVVVGQGHPLYLGRKKRAATLAQIVALIIRDGDTCAWVDCPLHVRFTQAHHIRPWLDGGLTDLDNLVLLCHKHHHLVHEGGWKVRLVDNRPRFYRPDGIPLEPGVPPPRLAA